MSQRHRTAEVPLPPKQELRAHAHGERHRIHVELDQVAPLVGAGADPEDLHEPGSAWKPPIPPLSWAKNSAAFG